MAFQDGYYRPLVTKWLNELSKEKNPSKRELLFRNIVSRAYYSMFLFCREVHSADVASLEAQKAAQNKYVSHEDIINFVTDGTIKSLLFLYKRERKKADYDLLPFSFLHTMSHSDLILHFTKTFAQIEQYKLPPQTPVVTPPSQNQTS